MANPKLDSPLAIRPANLQTAEIAIRGISPLVQNKFSAKAKGTDREDTLAALAIVAKTLETASATLARIHH